MTDVVFRALGNKVTEPTRNLETFPKPDGVEGVMFESKELTAFCPVTGQPDFYRLKLYYVPAATCIESKSLKLYLQTFRNEGHFAEALAARIAQDVHAACGASYVSVELRQSVRGGLVLTAEATVYGEGKS